MVMNSGRTSLEKTGALEAAVLMKKTDVGGTVLYIYICVYTVVHYFSRFNILQSPVLTMSR